jgi:hypothetical protein
MEDKHITGFVKHNLFDRQQNRRLRSKKPYTTDKLVYNEDKDLYYCPTGKPMKNIGEYTSITKAGFKQTITRYQAKKCTGCPLRDECHRQKGNRIIEVNHNLNCLKQKADKRLKSKRGIQKCRQRCSDTEPVFANIKHNHHFKRFMLRGIEKVNIETGLLALAHNLRKKTA